MMAIRYGHHRGGACFRYFLMFLFCSYLAMCVYIVGFAQNTSPLREMVIQSIQQQQQQDVQNRNALEPNSTNTWLLFKRDAHAQFHAEQDKLRAQQAERERKLKLERVFLNSTAKGLFQTWVRAKKRVNDCSIDFYDMKVAFLHDVALNRSLMRSKVKGGENISDVLNRKDEDEIINVKPGYFSVPFTNVSATNCSMNGFYGNAKHLKQWSKSVTGRHVPKHQETPNSYTSNFTILISRYEYANVYWAMMDLYDLYLTVTFLNQTMNETHLLIVDAHPFTPLDGLLEGIFKRVSRPSDLPEISHHKTLAWTFSREFSPMLNKQSHLPLIDEFRETVMGNLNVPTQHVRNCPRLNVMFVWRRNYVAHPRNPAGIIERKISNEDELVAAVHQHFREYSVTAVQLDSLPISKQLDLLSRTDVFIGMHGAAFGFTVLLPTGGAVLELFPHGHPGNWHMESLAKRSGHYYNSWKNKDVTLEDKVNKYTKVPPSVVIDLISKASVQMCYANRKPEQYKYSKRPTTRVGQIKN